eukprot:s4793_g6.t1
MNACHDPVFHPSTCSAPSTARLLALQACGGPLWPKPLGSRAEGGLAGLLLERVFGLWDSRAAVALRHLCWADVAKSAKGVAKFVAQNPRDFLQVFAVASDHYVSKARFHSNQGLPIPACICGHPLPDRAHEWTCASHCGTEDPMQPVGVLQAALAWPAHLRTGAENMRFLAQVVAVRRSTLTERYGAVPEDEE